MATLSAIFFSRSRACPPPSYLPVFMIGLLLVFPLCAVRAGERAESFDSRSFENNQRLDRLEGRGGGYSYIVPDWSGPMRSADSDVSVLRRRFFGSEDQQTVEPEPINVVLLRGKAIENRLPEQRVNACFSAITRIKGLSATAADKTYAEALVALDRVCMTHSAPPPNVVDLTVPMRSLVIISRSGRAFCTGMLLDASTLVTARHCFIKQADGTVREGFDTAQMKDVKARTADTKRTVFISDKAIDALKLPRGFDIDQDPVKVRVDSVAEPGALPLPRVESKAPQASQLLWIAGPFELLDQALAMDSPRAPTATAPSLQQWHYSIRWSAPDAAQCRVKAVGNACIYHTCQTSGGYSGSPMISATYVDERTGVPVIEYVGVHSGTPAPDKADNGWPACGIDTRYSAFNVGKNGGF